MGFILEIDYEEPGEGNLPCIDCKAQCPAYNDFLRYLSDYMWYKDQYREIKQETGENIVPPDLEGARRAAVQKAELMAEKIDIEDCFSRD